MLISGGSWRGIGPFARRAFGNACGSTRPKSWRTIKAKCSAPVVWVNGLPGQGRSFSVSSEP